MKNWVTGSRLCYGCYKGDKWNKSLEEFLEEFRKDMDQGTLSNNTGW